jgi:hypothetical protein
MVEEDREKKERGWRDARKQEKGAELRAGKR